jgi:hypothetical protein
MINREPPAGNKEKADRRKRERSGRALIEIMRDTRLRDLVIEPAFVRAPVRDIDLQEM